MLQKLRDQTQSTGFKILAGAIIVVLTLFGFGATNLFLSSAPEVASVGDVDITQGMLEAETERERRRILAQMGPEFDPSQIDRLQLQQLVLTQLITRYVQYQAAAELGIEVSPSRTNDELVNNENYRIDGRFDEDLYVQTVQMAGFTPAEFLNEVTKALSLDQLRLGLTESAFVTDWELSEAVRVITQKRDLAYLPLTTDVFAEGIEVSEEEIATRYEEDQATYMTELSVDVSYIAIGVDDLVNNPSIDVSDAVLLDEYEAEKADSPLLDGQRDSSHILVQINDERSEEAALALITEVAARIAEGGSFDDLAGEFSEDPGSRDQGGSLGPVAKGVFDPEFEAALWAMQEPGEISPPVKSSFGYHLIRLDEVIEGVYPSFDEQRPILEARLRRERALEMLDEKSRDLERSAYDERFSLVETAELLGLELETALGINRSNPPEDALMLASVNVMDMIFSDEVLNGENSELIELGDQVLVVRVDNQHLPEPIPLAEVAEAIRATLVDEKAFVAIEAAKEEALERLRNGASVTEVAETYGQRWRTFEAITRATGEDIPQPVLDTAFELPRPPEGEKTIGEASLPDGSAIVTVTRVLQGDVNVTTDAEIAQLEQGLINRARQIGYSSFFRAAEEKVGVSRLGGGS